jgi:hypothetical protein
MSGTLPPLFTITSDDHSGYVAVTLYTLLVLMVLLVTTRAFTRWYVIKSIKLDDVFLILAAVRNQSPYTRSANCSKTKTLAFAGSGGSAECFCSAGD